MYDGAGDRIESYQRLWRQGQDFARGVQSWYQRYRENRFQQLIREQREAADRFNNTVVVAPTPSPAAPPMQVALVPRGTLGYRPRYGSRRRYTPKRRIVPYRRAMPVARPLRPFYQTGGRFQTYGRWQPEHHWKMIAGSHAIDHTPEIITNDICGIAQGNGVDTRTAAKICLTKVAFRGYLSTAAATSNIIQSKSIWVYIIQDTQCNGAAATVLDVSAAGIFTSPNAANPLGVSYLNPYNYGRFKVLMKKKLTLSVQPGLDSGDAWRSPASTRPVYMAWHAKPGRAVAIEYDAQSTDGAIGTRRTNNVFVVAGTADNVTGSDDTVNLIGTWMVSFYDCA